MFSFSSSKRRSSDISNGSNLSRSSTARSGFSSHDQEGRNRELWTPRSNSQAHDAAPSMSKVTVMVNRPSAPGFWSAVSEDARQKSLGRVMKKSVPYDVWRKHYAKDPDGWYRGTHDPAPDCILYREDMERFRGYDKATSNGSDVLHTTGDSEANPTMGSEHPTHGKRRSWFGKFKKPSSSDIS